MHETIAAGLRELLGGDAGAHGDAPGAGARPAAGGRRRHRRAAWWGHIAHDDVDDAVVDRVQDAVLGGMGLLVLHSGHFSKLLRRLLGTSCSLRWRNAGERELVWTVAPAHPIAAGVPAPDRDRGAGDVRRALRHPRAGRAGVHQLVRGRRGVPRRLLLHARARAGSSTSARATRSTPCTTIPTSGACSRTRPAGPRRPRAATGHARGAGVAGRLVRAVSFHRSAGRAAARRGRRRGGSRSALGLRAASLRRRRARRLGRPRPGARPAPPRPLAADGVVIGDDVGATLDAVRPDFLVNVSPPGAHHAVTTAALERGVHVLSEKPMAASSRRPST